MAINGNQLVTVDGLKKFSENIGNDWEQLWVGNNGIVSSYNLVDFLNDKVDANKVYESSEMRLYFYADPMADSANNYFIVPVSIGSNDNSTKKILSGRGTTTSSMSNNYYFILYDVNMSLNKGEKFKLLSNAYGVSSATISYAYIYNDTGINITNFSGLTINKVEVR